MNNQKGLLPIINAFPHDYQSVFLIREEPGPAKRRITTSDLFCKTNLILRKKERKRDEERDGKK